MDDTCTSPNSNPDVCPNAICSSPNSSQKRTCMQWNIEKDIMMMREVAALGVLIQKPGSKERGQLWQQVSDSLNKNGFYVTSRGVRDRLSNIMKKHRAQANKEKKLSGEGGKEITEYDILVEELIEVSDDTDAQKDEKSQEKKNAVDEDRVKAIDIRNTAMERYGETRKRKALNNEDKSPKTSRRSSNDTLIFLREKMEADKENRRIEREERAEARALAQQQQNNIQNMFNHMLAQQTEILKMLLEKTNL
nr:uncharacterized protein LOC124811426 [Hydra vulgaris]